MTIRASGRWCTLTNLSLCTNHAAMYGRSLHVTTDTEEGADDRIRSHLARADIEVTSVKQIRPSLEDVFVALVRDEGGARSG